MITDIQNTTHNLRKRSKIFAIFSFLKLTSIKLAFVAVAALSTSFAMSSSKAYAQVHCTVVQQLGNHYSGRMVNAINTYAAGQQYRINKRKQLRLNRVQTLSFNGCRASIKAHVTLKRKVRRDGHGPVYMSGNVQAYLTPIGNGRNRITVCLSKMKVTRVKLSRTTRIGEGAYKFVANKVLPSRRCFSYNQA